MSEATTTNDFRKRQARFLADGTALYQITQMAFGDGGHNADNSPKTPDADQTALNHELLRKSLGSVTQEDLFSVTGAGVVLKSELVGYSISEAGLLDSAGNLLGFKNFAPKIKDDDEAYEISIKIKF